MPLQPQQRHACGSCKLLISHERTAYAREVLLIVNGQLKDAVDASCYVTTSQNYIRTKVGANGQTINISLKGGEDGDEANFQWSVKSMAADGSSAKVIDLETATGSVFHTAARAAAAGQFAVSEAVLEWDGTDADIYLYSLKMWNTYYTFKQAFDNYLVGLTDTEAMISEYEKNDVLVSQKAEGLTKDMPSMQKCLDAGLCVVVLTKNADTAFAE